MEKEFCQSGDIADHPYILKSGFTAKSDTLINGQTPTSMLNLSFVNKLGAMNDQTREKKREMFYLIKLLIIDEYSMVKSDMLYQISSRLKEIK